MTSLALKFASVLQRCLAIRSACVRVRNAGVSANAIPGTMSHLMPEISICKPHEPKLNLKRSRKYASAAWVVAARCGCGSGLQMHDRELPGIRTPRSSTGAWASGCFSCKVSRMLARSAPCRGSCVMAGRNRHVQGIPLDRIYRENTLLEETLNLSNEWKLWSRNVSSKALRRTLSACQTTLLALKFASVLQRCLAIRSARACI